MTKAIRNAILLSLFAASMLCASTVQANEGAHRQSGHQFDQGKMNHGTAKVIEKIVVGSLSLVAF